MRVIQREEIDKKLRKETGFFKGLWLLVLLSGRFLVSLGPHNWNITKITNSGRIDPLEQRSESSEVMTDQAFISADRK